MIDEMETARREMILSGLEWENNLRVSQARFDLYSRSDGSVDFRIGVYHEYIQAALPYVRFNFGDDDEMNEAPEEKKRADFMKQLKSINWSEAMNHLPVAVASKV